MNTTDHRLVAVEKQLRLHRVTILSLLIALVAVMTFGATSNVQDVVRTRRIEIIGDSGLPLLVATSTFNQGILSIFDQNVPIVTIGPAQPAQSDPTVFRKLVEGASHGRLFVYNGGGEIVFDAGARDESGRGGGGSIVVSGPRSGARATLGANTVSGWLDLRGRFSSADSEQTYLAADGLSVRAIDNGRAVNRLNLVVQGSRGVIEANGAALAR